MSQPKVSKSSIFAIIAGVIVVLLVCAAGSLFEDADKSKNYVCQMPVTGEYVVWTDGGLKWQGGGNKYEYFKTSQIEFVNLEEVSEQYEILKNWEKVAQHFGLTRRVIQGIRRKDS